MNGQEVYRFAVSSCVRDLRAVCEKADVPLEAVDWFLLHQANQRILNAAQTRLKQPKEKFPGNIERLGNTSSACIRCCWTKCAATAGSGRGSSSRCPPLARGSPMARRCCASDVGAARRRSHKKSIHTSFARRNFP